MRSKSWGIIHRRGWTSSKLEGRGLYAWSCRHLDSLSSNNKLCQAPNEPEPKVRDKIICSYLLCILHQKAAKMGKYWQCAAIYICNLGPCHLHFKTTSFDDKKVLSADICSHLHSALFVFKRHFVGYAMFWKHNFWSFEIRVYFFYFLLFLLFNFLNLSRSASSQDYLQYSCFFVIHQFWCFVEDIQDSRSVSKC
jgi:hypothetical protein